MPRRIHSKDGNFAIYDSEVPAALTDPASYPSSVYLHDSHDYYRIVYDQTVSLALPSRSDRGSAIYTPFPAHSLGYRPRSVLRIANRQMPSMAVVQGGALDDTRFLGLVATTTGFEIMEVWACDDGSETPAITFSLRVIAYGVATKYTYSKQLHFFPDTGRLIAARGNLDTDNLYLRKVDSGDVDFFATAARSVDHYRSGIKQVDPNGSNVTGSGYSGSFSGGPFYGVAD